MQTLKKAFTVDNALLTLEVWERHQTQGYAAAFGRAAPPTMFDVRSGVADVYYQDETFRTIRDTLKAEYEKDPSFLFKAMDRYEADLEAIMKIIAEDAPLRDAQALAAFAAQFAQTWIGLDESYLPDYLSLDATAERRAAAAREKAFGFYVGADRIVRLTVAALFPELGDLAKLLTLEEAVSAKAPDRSVLEARAVHYVFYKGKVSTGISFEDYCKNEAVRIESIYASLRDSLRGAAASGGKANGPARVLKTDADRASFKAGEVLVAKDVSAHDIPLINMASAVLLDEGNYYGTAAIAARAAGKPCLFATKVATLALKNGDRLAIDADAGTVRVGL